jgi:hypothetical protein
MKVRSAGSRRLVSGELGLTLSWTYKVTASTIPYVETSHVRRSLASLLPVNQDRVIQHLPLVLKAAVPKVTNLIVLRKIQPWTDQMACKGPQLMANA